MQELIVGIVLIPKEIQQMPTNWYVSFRIGSIIIAIALGAFFAYGATAAWRAKKKKPVTGRVAMIGKKGVAITKLDPYGQVKVTGEIWRAKAEEENIEEEMEIVVLEKDGLLLKVRKA